MNFSENVIFDYNYFSLIRMSIKWFPLLEFFYLWIKCVET